jgi:toxin ParE1/3/4
MNEYTLSKKSEDDINDIAEYSVDQFGILQARHYRDGLIRCFENLSAHPEIGRIYFLNDKRNLFRFRFKSHVIFYEKFPQRIFIVRILGGQINF